MSYISELARVLRDNEYIKVSKQAVDAYVKPMADDIYSCPIRNRQGRSYEEVYRNCSRIAGEFALESVLLSVGELSERNPNLWNHRNEESFMYDVVHYRHPDVYKLEFKRMIGKWFSMKQTQVGTFRKHASKLNALVTGYVDEFPDHYGINFSLVINPKTFDNYWTPSLYRNDKKATNNYYDHFTASKRGDCVIIRSMETRTKEYYDDLNFVKEEE